MIDFSPLVHQTQKFTRLWLCLALFFFAQAQGQSQMLNEETLQKETSLQTKVTLEVSKKPLDELLSLLQRQSGVKLSYTPESPAKAVRVTARFNQMTLADALCALSRIYGVQWQKAKDSYVMHRYPKDDLHLLMFHRVGRAGFLTPEEVEEMQKDVTDFAGQIYDSIPENSWKSPEGVPFTAVPTDLQEKMRMRDVEQQILSFATQVRYEEKAANDDLELRLSSIAPGSIRREYMFFPPLNSQFTDEHLKYRGPGWLLYSSKGELVIPIFPEMHGPSAFDKEREAELLQMAKDVEASRLRLEKDTQKVGAKPAR